MCCANCNFIFHGQPFWNAWHRLLGLKRHPAHEFKSFPSEAVAQLSLRSYKSLWSSCTFHKEMGGQAAPKSCARETQKFIHNGSSVPRFSHASVDLKCWWTCFLGNVCSILTQSLIAPKHLKDTSKLHYIGWGKKNLFSLWTKSQGTWGWSFFPSRARAACELQKWTIHIGLSGELVLMWNCNLDWRPISCMPY